MTTIGFAVLAAVGFSLFNVLTQLALKGSDVGPFTALFHNLAGGTLALLVLATVVGRTLPDTPNWDGILYFAAAGLITALVGQAALIASIPRIGATRASCFLLADNIFALVLGSVILGQMVSILSGVGIFILMAGAALFILETAQGAKQSRTDTPRGLSLVVGIGNALLAALCFAAGGVLRGKGIAVMPTAVLGSAVNVGAALIALTTYYGVSGRLRGLFAVNRRQLSLLMLSGVANAAGTLAFVLALQSGATVAVTIALKNTSPLLTFGLAIPLLRRYERLNARLGVTVFVVVAGAVMIALGRG